MDAARPLGEDRGDRVMRHLDEITHLPQHFYARQLLKVHGMVHCNGQVMVRYNLYEVMVWRNPDGITHHSKHFHKRRLLQINCVVY